MVHERIRQARLARRMTQTAAGKHLGYSSGMLSRMEKGDIYIKTDTLKRMCLLYHVSSDWILELKESDIF